MYDIKYLMKFCGNLHGGLSKLAETLRVERIGPQHQAGSDSLLTSFTFLKLTESLFQARLGLATACPLLPPTHACAARRPCLAPARALLHPTHARVGPAPLPSPCPRSRAHHACTHGPPPLPAGTFAPHACMRRTRLARHRDRPGAAAKCLPDVRVWQGFDGVAKHRGVLYGLGIDGTNEVVVNHD